MLVATKKNAWLFWCYLLYESNFQKCWPEYNAQLSAKYLMNLQLFPKLISEVP